MRVAIVTGGSRGIGLGITEQLLEDGYRVAVLATRPEPPETFGRLLADEPERVRYLVGSVADVDTHAPVLDAVVAAWGRLDVLVNNAGVAPSARADLLEATPESFDRVLDINLRGPYFLTQAFARRVIELRGPATSAQAEPVATIVNVSSISASTVSTDRGDYCISKAGVGMATQLWAARLASEGIVVYEVRPGVIATDMTAAVTEKYDALLAKGLAPIARWGRPADVAGAVSLLVSGRTPYSTGEIFHVDGGMHISRL